ncbi:MAG: amidoligase family protein [Clostridiales bacterium]|nr:amidoligase family protein [Clostridiales bacterium]
MKENKNISAPAGLTTICAKCGKKVLSIYSVSDSETTVCFDCYKKYYYRCSKCGEIKSLDVRSERPRSYETYPYLVYYDVETGKNCFICVDCQEKNTAINDSCYKPKLKFHTDDIIPRFFGVELEVDRGEDSRQISDTYENRDGHVYNVLNIANKKNSEENIYVKCDGSLHRGFEIVSHPMTLDYHIKNMPWKEVMSYLTEAGYLSHNTDTCGLHIHVNRDSFGYSEKDRIEAMSRLLYFTEKNSEKLFIFSRRTRSQINEWANWYGERSRPGDYRELFRFSNGEKYRTINLTHRETIEFRLYKGTLNYNTFIASLQMTNELCRIAVIYSDDEIVNLSWEDFIKGINHEKNAELMEYLKKRGLYGEEKEKKEDL